MRNLLLEQLDERAQMLTGRHKALSMVEGVQHGDVDGDRLRRLPHGRRHRGRARPHLPPQLDHRRLGQRRPARARAAQRAWSPPSTASRSSWSPATTAPAWTPRDYAPEARTVAVKDYVSRYAAVCRTAGPHLRPTSATAAQEAVALAGRHDARTGGPFTVELEFDADAAGGRGRVVPGVDRVAERRVRYTAPTDATRYPHVQGRDHTVAAVEESMADHPARDLWTSRRSTRWSRSPRT